MFALATLAAFAAAADSEQPVISLDLQYRYGSKGFDYRSSRFTGLKTNYQTSQHPKNRKPQALTENRFADECNVDTGSKVVHFSDGTYQTKISFLQKAKKYNCQEPNAIAYDHHDGDLSSSIKTTYTLFVRSDPLSSPRDVSEIHRSIKTDLRGEYVIQYDVKDSNGNDAEQVQFALIFVDEVAPRFINSPGTFIDQGARLYQSPPQKAYSRYASVEDRKRLATHCEDFDSCEDNYRTYFRSYYMDKGVKKAQSNIVLELCGPLGKPGYKVGEDIHNLYWANDDYDMGTAPTKPTPIRSYDNYDGELGQDNSAMNRDLEYKISVFAYNAIDDFFYDHQSTNEPNPAAEKDMRFPVPKWKSNGSGGEHAAQACMREISKATRGKCDVAKLMTQAQAVVHPDPNTLSSKFISYRDQCISCTDDYKVQVEAKRMTSSACWLGINRKKYNNWFCGRPAMQYDPEETYYNIHDGKARVTPGRMSKSTYAITSSDYADIFGKNNENNVNSEEGKIYFQDSIIPTLQMPATEVCMWGSTGTHKSQNPVTKVFEEKTHTKGTTCMKVFSDQGCECHNSNICTKWNSDSCSLTCTPAGAVCWDQATKMCALESATNAKRRISPGKSLYTCAISKAGKAGYKAYTDELEFQCAAEGKVGRDMEACQANLCCMDARTQVCKVDTASTKADCTDGNVNYECGYKINHKQGDAVGAGKTAYMSRDPVTGEWIKSYRPSIQYFDCYDTPTKNQNWVQISDGDNSLFDFDLTSANWVGLKTADGCKKELPYTDSETFRKVKFAIYNFLAKGKPLWPKNQMILASEKKKAGRGAIKTPMQWALLCAKTASTTMYPVTPYITSNTNKYNILWTMKQANCVTRCEADTATSLVTHTKGCKNYCAKVATYNGPKCFSKPSAVQLRYNVNDNFGNHATEQVTQIGIEDTLAPTLFITKHDYIEAEGNQYNMDKSDYEKCDKHNKESLDKTTGHFTTRNCEGVRFCTIDGVVHTGKICAGKTMHGRYEHQTIDHSKKVQNMYSGTIYPRLPFNTGCKKFCQQRRVLCQPLEEKDYKCEQVDPTCKPECAHLAGELSKIGWQKNPNPTQTDPYVEHQYMDIDGKKTTKADWVNVAGQDGEEEWLKSGQTMMNIHSTVDMRKFYNVYADQMVVQHSAGYAGDYAWIEELLHEGTGYECFDMCSDTTTTVQWQASCSGSKPGKRFEMKVPGTYYLKYDCYDEKGDNAVAHHTTACRTFVNIDRTRPILEVYEQVNNKDGFFHVEASRDNNYVDAGAACSDMVDGIISDDVQVSGDVVNMAAVGTYVINYDCEDDAGRQAYQAHRTVIVEDTTCPTCSIPGDEPTITIEASFPYSEAKSTCSDNIDGALSNATRHGSVNVELTGTYVLTYTSTDSNGNGKGMTPTCKAKTYTSAGWVLNRASHFTKTVIVEDTMIPIISLKYKKGKLMAETSANNAWVIGAVASAISGVALLGYAASRKSAVSTTVPV